MRAREVRTGLSSSAPFCCSEQIDRTLFGAGDLREPLLSGAPGKAAALPGARLGRPVLRVRVLFTGPAAVFPVGCPM